MGIFGDAAPSPCPMAASGQDPHFWGTHPLRACTALTAVGLLYCKLHQVTRAASFKLRTLLGPLAAVSQHCTPSHGGEPASSAWPQHLQCRKATHGDGAARNIIYGCAKDGKGRYIGPRGDSSTRFNLHKGYRGLQSCKKALPSSPSNHEQQEQHASGSNWFAPVASLQAPRDSCSGTAGFLKGHL